MKSLLPKITRKLTSDALTYTGSIIEPFQNIHQHQNSFNDLRQLTDFRSLACVQCKALLTLCLMSLG